MDRGDRRLVSALLHIEGRSPLCVVERAECAVRAESYVHYREEELKWNGWGYADTEFRLGEEGEVILAGNKYSLSGKVNP